MQLGIWVRFWALGMAATAVVGCDSGATTGDGAAGSGAEKVVSLTTGNSKVVDGGKFFTPLDKGTATVALFSEQKDIWTLRNGTAAEITVDSITVKTEAGTVAEEFQIYNNAIPSVAAELKGI